MPDTTPVTGVLPVSPIPTVTSLTSPAPMAVRLTTAVRSARPASPTRIAVRRRFPVTTDVPRPTPVVSASLVRAIPIVTYPTSLVTAVVRRPIPVANALPVTQNAKLTPVLQDATPICPAPTVVLLQTPVEDVMFANLVPRRQMRPDVRTEHSPVLTAAAGPDCVVLLNRNQQFTLGTVPS